MTVINFRQICVDYLTALRQLVSDPAATDELSLRHALHEFLQAAVSLLGYPVQLIGEARAQTSTFGKPDFVLNSNDLPIGYVEAEAYNVDLDRLTGHAKTQNDGFRTNLDNFLLTNHLEFRLYIGGKLEDSEGVPRVARLPIPAAKGPIRVLDEEASAVAALLEWFLHPTRLPGIDVPHDLATHLARRTRLMCDYARVAVGDTHAGNLHDQYKAFKEVLLPDLTGDQFADMYAQTIAYGLFAARCASPTSREFSRQTAADLLPPTNPFLRKLFQHVAAHDLDERIAWIADDMAALLTRCNIGDIVESFSRRTGREDPVVHFYETFLSEYDQALREVRGVYYTPEPVVSYIVRSIDHLLKTRFNKPMGLADENTLLLDPATGTGSFLFAVVHLIHDTVRRTMGEGGWSDYVERHLLPRLFGFELLIAPYAVAHLKLGLSLQETGYTFRSDQRVGVYLTNTLEEAIKRARILFAEFISNEANAAVQIKREQPILVVLGNPPYSGHSANRSRDGAGNLTFIGRLIEDYKQVEGKPLGEKNPKWLQDDSVKFIRFAQWRIEQTGEGVVGYITNHGYLDNPTFRGMRQNLMQTFTEIYVLDLHGNSKKKERAPDGGKDENVFDIQQGVAILLCVKHPTSGDIGATNLCARVYHADLWGLRADKYQQLLDTDISTSDWTKLQPASPFYLFVPKNIELLGEYEEGWRVTDIFQVYASTVTTARNQFSVAYDPATLVGRIADLKDKSRTDDELREKYGLKDVSYWSLAAAREELSQLSDVPAFVQRYCYRPFDFRYVFYHQAVCERLRPEVMRHMQHDNIALLTHRPQSPIEFTFAYCTNLIGDQCVAANKTVGGGNSFQFPLYLFDVPSDSSSPSASSSSSSGKAFHARGYAQMSMVGFFVADGSADYHLRRPNLSPAFLKALAEKLNLPQTEPHGLPHEVTPEHIFHYAYAVFHSPTYRTRYAEFLKMDFPRLPLTSDLNLFRHLAALGRELVALHLLDTAAAPALNDSISPFPRTGSNVVERVTYDELNHEVHINKDQCFVTVPADVWEFRVGGYQVCDKWLKDRSNSASSQGRKLTYEDIRHYQRIIIALRETIRLMGEVDQCIPQFPIQ